MIKSEKIKTTKKFRKLKRKNKNLKKILKTKLQSLILKFLRTLELREKQLKLKIKKA